MIASTAFTAQAETIKVRSSLDVNLATGFGLDGDNEDLLRLGVQPKLEAKFKSGWKADLHLTLKTAQGDVGLGTIETFDELSRPLTLGDSSRIEIDKATLSWRKRSTRLTLGKQTVAWGVLDGLQVTDRLDASRRQEAVFTDERPDRLSRWGARAEFKKGGFGWDAVAFIDGSADQLASQGSAYEVRASRFRAGLPIGVPTPDVSVETSNDVTVGLRTKRKLGRGDVSALIIHGPDTEPVFRSSDTGVSLEYDTRTLLGATWQRSEGPRVWRIEAASISDQPVNVSGAVLDVEDRQRWLAGAGLDWDLSDSKFLNLQIGVDHVEGQRLVRPNTDVIATVRAQKGLSNDTIKLSAELLTSLSDGDGTFRPAISWQKNDHTMLSAGVDAVWGDEEGLFGQFDNNDRVWFKVDWSV